MGDSCLISDSPSGSRTLTLKGEVSNKDKESLRGKQFASLFVRHGDHRCLDYLASSFQGIRILYVGSEQFDWAIISRMPNLERLSIGAYWVIPWHSIENENLESLSITWDKRYAVKDLQFPSLRHLKVIGWKKKDLDELTQLKRLTYLDLVDSRQLSNLTSLESLWSVSTFRLRGAPKLASLSGIERLSKLIVLDLEGLKRIEGYDTISSLKSLRGLVMRGCAPIQSLLPLAILPNLEFLLLGDTKVEDGDLEVLKSFPALKRVIFKNKRGNNWTPKMAKEHFEASPRDQTPDSDELQDALRMKL